MWEWCNFLWSMGIRIRMHHHGRLSILNSWWRTLSICLGSPEHMVTVMYFSMEDWLSWTFSRHHAEDKKDNPAQLRRRRREAFDCIVKHDYFCLCVWLLKLSACKCSWCPLDFWPHVFGLFLWLLAVGPAKKGFKKPCIWATNILFQNWFIKLEGPGWLKIHWGRPRQPVKVIATWLN